VDDADTLDRSLSRQGIARSLIQELHRRENTATRLEVSTGAANTQPGPCTNISATLWNAFYSQTLTFS
jgi:hypothetical protein